MNGRRRARLAAALVLAVLPLAAAGAFVAAPVPSSLLDRGPVSSLLVLDRDGEALSSAPSAEGQQSYPLDEVPAPLRLMLVAAEDGRFLSHAGVDVRALVRAAKDSLAAGRVVSGASTITQQLARRLVPRPRTVVGKIGEALWALRLEVHLDKERILLEYANRLPLGRGAVGVEAASRAHFGKPARALTLGESALLAGLAHAPAREDPHLHPERALARRDWVLARARSLGLIDDAAWSAARAEQLELAPPSASGGDAPVALHFVQRQRRRASPGVAVLQTTLDRRLQREAERIVEDELGALEERRVGQAAVVVLDNASGEVLAWVGSRDWSDEARLGKNDGVSAHRQPGSALKPFVYGLALSRGFTAASLLADVETTLATDTGSYAPRNYDERVHGPVRLRAALQNSYNIPAVQLAERLGPARILDTLRAAGFASLDESAEHYGVGIVLGDGDVTLLELANGYRGLANGGVATSVVELLHRQGAAGGSAAPVPAGVPVRFLPEDAVALLTDVLVDDVSRAPAFGRDNALDLPFPVAAKTGTSRAYVDNWTAGFTRERTVAVWAGNFDGTPMHNVSGITGAGRIFRRVMLAAMREIAPARLVDEGRFESAAVCPLSGLLAGPHCGHAVAERFLPGTTPRERCTSHTRVASTPAGCASRVGPALELPPRFRSWARGEGLALADGMASCPTRARAVRLLSPLDGDEFVVDATVPSGQGIPVRVDAAATEDVRIALDGAPPRTLAPPHATWLDAAPGAHELTLFVDGRLVQTVRYRVD
ncbi:MAG: penicillin-binding protein 1C [Deltaproteobacteria bacterium]|nr:penicillin-binding protein 1C [Deltaproteobacteria bacterium]